MSSAAVWSIHRDLYVLSFSVAISTCKGLFQVLIAQLYAIMSANIINPLYIQ